MKEWCKRNRAEKRKKKQRKKQLKKTEESQILLLTEKEEKSLQSKKLNYFVTECASHQIHIPLLRERERDDDDEKNV
jgi:hypothetical protein